MKNNIYCSSCGNENYPLLKYCSNCGSILKTRRINESQCFNSIKSFINLENRDIIVNTRISINTYNKIIENICNIGLMNLKYNQNESALEKIVKIVKQYSKFSYSRENGFHGYYYYNSIFVNDKLNDAEKIATIIHELSHHLLSEIFEQLLMYIFNVKKTSVIESFVMYILHINPYYRINNEFLAYTCEESFTPYGYASFNSVIDILLSKDLDSKRVEDMYVIGNTMANDVIDIIKVFIDEDMQDEIYNLFKKEDIKYDYNHVELRNKGKIHNPHQKIEVLKSLILDTFNLLLSNKVAYSNLESFVDNFDREHDS